MSILIDLAEYGRRVRAARILAAHATVATAADLITERTGVPVSERTLGAIERGQQMPSLEQFLAIALAFEGQIDHPRYWAAAIRDDVEEWFLKGRGDDGDDRAPSGPW